jgi:transcriptional antiterminator RfaH
MSKEWFILQFKPNSHHLAAKNLNQQGFETFLPLHDITSRKTSRFISTRKPLFPGYMFVTFDRAKTEWHKINNTYGVLRLVTFNSILKSIPNIFIESLMMRCDLSGKILPIEKLKKGDQVKITKGPFKNFIANVEEYETDHRIWILMDFMGRKTKIITPSDGLRLSDCIFTQI